MKISNFINDNRYYEKIGKNEPIDITDDLPFDIPDSWEWIRLPSLTNFYLGKTPERDNHLNWSNDFPWVSIADMKDKSVISLTKEKISNYALSNKFNSQFSPRGTLIMSFKLTVGRTSILDMDAVHNEAIISIVPFITTGNIIRTFLLNLLGLLVEYCDTTDAIKGVTLNKDKLNKLLIPLPPIAEQQRIVEKIESMEPYLAQYDKIEKQLTKLESEIKDKLKKSILQYAIQGKLVKQNPNDEPASILLERIKAEKEQLIKEGKIKRDKNESFIYKGDDKNYYENINGKVVNITEEIPFDIPDSWCWCRFGKLFNVQTGASFKKDIAIAENKENYVRVLRGGNVFPFKLKLKADDLFIPRDIVKNDILLAKNDLVTPAVTSLENIGKIGIVKENLHNITAGGFVYIFRLYIDNEILSNLNMFFISSPTFVQLMKSITKKSGQAFYNMSKERLLNLLLPIPPIEEQLRILKKIKDFEKEIE